MSGGIEGNGADGQVKKAYYSLTFPALAVVFLDQMTKTVIVHTIQLHGSITVIRGFFDLVHIRNRGMAFGILNRPGADFSYYFLIAVTFIAVGLLFFWFLKIKGKEPYLIVPLSFILGGALGNLVDRIWQGHVIDFLDVYSGSYHWPAFNVADSAITVGTLWLAILILFKRPPVQKKKAAVN